MFYSGKYLDLFESVMKILFRKKGYEAGSHLDAMGKRCFGFYNREDKKGYYIPIVDTREAVEAIAAYMNLEKKLQVYSLEAVEEVMEYVSEGVVYGPVEEEVAVRRIKNLYYHAENCYVYIQAGPEGMYCVTDPDGFPVLYYSEEEISSLLCRGKGVLIRLKENDGIHRNIESVKVIWRDGWKFHRMATESVRETTLWKDAFESYNGSASSQIALRYGVMNFLEHTEKVWRLGSDLGVNTEEWDFRKLQCEMMKIAEKGQVEKLPLIEAAIWKVLTDEI